MTEETYDVIVLGGGPGGVAAAVRASQLGGRVGLIEGETLGGFCMNRGCIPFGHMMIASNILGGLPLGKEMGLDVKEVLKDYSALIKRQNGLIDFMRMGVSGTLAKNKIKIIKGKGRIAGSGKIEVDGQTFLFRKLILATGAKWLKPDFPGADLEEVINSDDLLRLEALPKKVLLFGESPWLIEIAQFLNRYGTQVLLATKDKRILSMESQTIASRLRKVLKGEGVEIKTQAEIVAVMKKEDGAHVDLSSKDGAETVVVDRIIHLERAAALKDLGLKTVHLDEEGPYIQVNDRMETRADGVYAVGDVTGDPSGHYSHRASEGGIIAAENAMGKKAFMNPKTMARILFTQPQVACLGLTGKEAKGQGYDVMVGAAPFSVNPFGMIIAENEGIVEVVADKRFGEILGVHILGRNASEMVGQAVLAMQMEGTVEELARASFPHPTLSESFAEAAREALGRPIYLP